MFQDCREIPRNRLERVKGSWPPTQSSLTGQCIWVNGVICQTWAFSSSSEKRTSSTGNYAKECEAEHPIYYCSRTIRLLVE